MGKGNHLSFIQVCYTFESIHKLFHKRVFQVLVVDEIEHLCGSICSNLHKTHSKENRQHFKVRYYCVKYCAINFFLLYRR